MATRGTYKIDGHLCYNHWDNYPEGAAIHLLKTIKSQKGVSFFDCVRGMPGLQLATSKFDGPAEYYYEIKEGNITAHSIRNYGGMGDVVSAISGTVPIEQWINEELSNSMKKHKDDFFEEGETAADYTVIKYKGCYYTASKLHEMGLAEYKRGDEAMGKGWIGNGSGAYQEAFEMLVASGLPFDELKEKWPPVAEDLTQRYNHKNPDYFLSYREGVQYQHTM